jgi:AcrR family transcriptional regulator
VPDGSRRRGQELEDALLEAAWEELGSVGYAGFTIEGVAERAGTSRPVLYRRWATRSELAIAAIRHHGWRHPVTLPDTGNLRDDLIALLRAASAQRTDIGIMISVAMGHYFAETGSSIAELREQIMQGVPPRGHLIFERAVERGEIDPKKLTPRIISLPFDLLRHELMTTLQPVPDAVIDEIVDDIVLPLVRRGDV